MSPQRSPLAVLRGLPYVAWIILFCALSWGVFGAMLGAVTPNLRAQMGVSLQQMGWLMALMFVIAVFETALFTVGHGLLAEMSDDPEQRARTISLVDVGYSLGTLLSPLMTAAMLLANPSWRGPYLLFGLMALFMLALTLQRRALREVAFRQVPADSTSPAPSRQPMDYAALLRQPVVRWVLVAGVCSGLCEWGQYFWFVSFATEALGQHEQTARLALGFLMAGMVAGRIWQAFVHSRWRMEQKIQGLGALAALALLGVWLGSPGVPFAWLALCNFLTGLGVSVGFPILLGIALRSFPQEAPRLSALLMIAFTVGAQVAALLVGELAQQFGLRLAYLVLVLAALGFFAAAWVLARQR